MISVEAADPSVKADGEALIPTGTPVDVEAVEDLARVVVEIAVALAPTTVEKAPGAARLLVADLGAELKLVATPQ